MPEAGLHQLQLGRASSKLKRAAEEALSRIGDIQTVQWALDQVLKHLRDPQHQVGTLEALLKVHTDPLGEADSSWIIQTKRSSARTQVRADSQLRARMFSKRVGGSNGLRIVYTLSEDRPEVVAIDTRADIYNRNPQTQRL